MLRDLDEGRTLDRSAMTVGAYLDEWVDKVVKPSMGLNSVELYRRVVSGRLKPALGRLRLQELRKGSISRFLYGLTGEGLSVDTIKLYRAVLRRALAPARRRRRRASRR